MRKDKEPMTARKEKVKTETSSAKYKDRIEKKQE